MLKDFPDHRRLFDRGDDSHFSAAQVTGLNVDPKYPLQKAMIAGWLAGFPARVI